MPKTLASELVKHRFSNGQLAKILRVADGTDYEKALSTVGLYRPTSTLLVIGGASHMTQESQAKLIQFFNGPLATLSEKLDITVLDGGTDAGVTHMMGHARHYISGQFNLVGVAPLRRIIFPGKHQPKLLDNIDPQLTEEYDKDCPPVELEPHHTHFFLVSGYKWGSESRWLAEFSSVLAGYNPSMTLLINGGQVSLMDLKLNLELGRKVIIVAGSGRLADTVANTISGVNPDNETIQHLVKTYYPSQLSVFDLLATSLDDLRDQLSMYFNC
ncbi:hypothetical protein [Leptothoe spongobia]|uniref:LSDAT prokaryote domain-containing protein n=1 Tax=Leptothoe spongobia TAU-MAC 1115 TaxID=1967444 RepID=A0A947DGB7_9CYAN|nr:hypothetical protein [Leptothoe spongobia]MBT9315884.1 hypothetical protein [Leptothoe spongobia TAU-MAC 1115]